MLSTFAPLSFLVGILPRLALGAGLSVVLCASFAVAAALPAGYDTHYAPTYAPAYGGRGEVRATVTPPAASSVTPLASTVLPASFAASSPVAASAAAFSPSAAPAPEGLSGREIRASVRGPADEEGNTLDYAGPGGSVDVYAGDATFGGIGNARDNTLNFYGSQVISAVGGIAAEEATGNKVYFYGGQVTNVIHGGAAQGAATGNRVELYGGRIGIGTTTMGVVTGGNSVFGDANHNSVLQDGAQVDMQIVGGESNGGNALYNMVELKKGTVSQVFGGRGLGGSANHNTAILSGSAEVFRDIIVGSGWQDASGNTLYISGGKTLGAMGGEAQLGDARDNVIHMEGGIASILVAGTALSGIAAHNNVLVTGGTVLQSIAGGASISGYAINNTVTISGNPDIAGASVYGGQPLHPSNTPMDMFTGNTLNLDGFQGRARTVGNFEHYNFFLPAHIANGSVILELSEATTLSAPPGKSIRARITGMAEGGAMLKGGDTIHLIQSTAGLVSTGVDLSGGSFNQGIAAAYDYVLKSTGTTLDAVILGAEAAEDADSPTDGPGAAGGLVNGGADVAAGPGMDNALASARLTHRDRQIRLPPDPKGWGVGVFGVYTGSRTIYTSADHLRVNANHYVAGFTKLWDTDAAEILIGVYFDAGVGSYGNERTGARAEGDSRYQGGGLLARYAVTRGSLSGAYAEATARAGAVHSRYQSPDLTRKAGQEVKSESVSPYYSAHAGLGWVLPLGENTALDIYGKFFWSRLEASEQRIAGDKYRFDPTDSYRARGGARLSHKLGNNFSLYAGAAYEHEFGGEVQGKVYDFDVYGADIRGGTGLGEVGISFSLGDQGNFAVDISGQGFVGQREGFAGQVRAQYLF